MFYKCHISLRILLNMFTFLCTSQYSSSESRLLWVLLKIDVAIQVLTLDLFLMISRSKTWPTMISFISAWLCLFFLYRRTSLLPLMWLSDIDIFNCISSIAIINDESRFINIKSVWRILFICMMLILHWLERNIFLT